jgi:F-type H+-transporting ATPase subunit b
VHEAESLFSNPEFWVGVAFLGFVALLLYYKVPALVSKALDARAETLRKEIEEARKLRDEAANLLADYKRRAGDAQKEADAIIERAKQEAAALAAESRASMTEMMQRRTKSAEEKIARAQAQAMADVRSAAIDAAVGAAHGVIGSRLTGQAGHDLVARHIGELKGRM